MNRNLPDPSNVKIGHSDLFLWKGVRYSMLPVTVVGKPTVQMLFKIIKEEPYEDPKYKYAGIWDTRELKIIQKPAPISQNTIEEYEKGDPFAFYNYKRSKGHPREYLGGATRRARKGKKQTQKRRRL